MNRLLIILINDLSDSNHSSIFTERRKKKIKTASKANALECYVSVSIVCESYLFYASCIRQFMTSRKQQYLAYC